MYIILFDLYNLVYCLHARTHCKYLCVYGICRLFNAVVSSSDYIMMDSRAIKECSLFASIVNSPLLSMYGNGVC
jgi:hypothetical protein